MYGATIIRQVLGVLSMFHIRLKILSSILTIGFLAALSTSVVKASILGTLQFFIFFIAFFTSYFDIGGESSIIWDGCSHFSSIFSATSCRLLVSVVVADYSFRYLLC